MDATVEIGSGGLTQTLILDPSTIFQPLSSSIDMFKVDGNAQLSGAHIVFPATMIYMGKAISIESTINTNNLFHLSHINIDASLEDNYGRAAGYGIYISPSPSTEYVQLANIDDIKIYGMEYELYLYATGATGYVNGNNFSNIQLNSGKYLLTFDTTGSTGAGGYGIVGNNFANIQFEASGSTAAIHYVGSGYETSNTYTNAGIWDTNSPTVPVLNEDSKAIGNTYNGSMQSLPTISDDPNMAPSLYPYQNVYQNTGGITTALYSRTLGSVSTDTGGDATLLLWTVGEGYKWYWDSAGTSGTCAQNSICLIDGSNSLISLDIDSSKNFGIGSATTALSDLFFVTYSGAATAASLTNTGQSSYAGYGACYTTAGAMGHCTTAIGSTGTCTCVR
jgi:hypothetical protein